MSSLQLHPFSWDRVDRAVEKIHDRRRRTVAALEAAGVPYALIGGNAVAIWVARVDEEAVRNTKDVDILLRRSDLEMAKKAMSQAGFIYRHSAGIDMFLDGPGAKARSAVHVVLAGEKVKRDDLIPAPDVADSEHSPSGRVLSLEPLVRMKLTSFRRNDQVHLEDFISVGLVDLSWPGRFPPELADRLNYVFDTLGH
jgi:hypothetical protein